MSFSTQVGLIKKMYKHPIYMGHLLNKKIRFSMRCRWAEKITDKDDRVPLPLVYELTLTLKCNLRCHMCMLWGDAGWCGTLGGGKLSEELDIGIIKKIFDTGGSVNPSFILHGGEPLLHSRFREIVLMLKEKRHFATVCTNGTLLNRFKNEIDGNPCLDLLISLDGLEKENDLIRGNGTFKKVVNNIKLLRSLKNPPHMGLQFTILPQNVHVMYKFCKLAVDLGVDWVLLNPCWYLSEEQKKAYTDFMAENFNMMPKTQLGYFNSYDLNTNEFVLQYKKIVNENWPIQISCYLNNPAEDIFDYVHSSNVFTGNTFCYKQWLRMDVTPEGKVTPCVRYPDLVFGDLKTEDILQVWNSSHYEKFRKIVRRKTMPICKKCNCLYLYDAKRKHL